MRLPQEIVEGIPDPSCGLTYWAVKKAVPLLVPRLARQWRLEGSVPLMDSLIVVCNHVSPLDPPLVISMMPRAVYCMAKASLFTPEIKEPGTTAAEIAASRWLGRFLPKCGAFPVIRGQEDRHALRVARTLLRQGQAVVIFCEGGISADKYLKEAKRGAALLALSTKTPVLVTYLQGTGAKWEGELDYSGPARLVVGPLVYPTLKQFQEGTVASRTAQLAETIEEEMRSLGKRVWNAMD